MKGKKTEQVAFRVSSEEKEFLEQVAEEMNMKLGALAGSLVTQFVEFRRSHGNRLIWPPEFNYYPPTSKSIQDKENILSGLANESPSRENSKS